MSGKGRIWGNNARLKKIHELLWMVGPVARIKGKTVIGRVMGAMPPCF